MHFKTSSAICFNLDQSKILSSGNGLSYWQTDGQKDGETDNKKQYAPDISIQGLKNTLIFANLCWMSIAFMVMFEVKVLTNTDIL